VSINTGAGPPKVAVVIACAIVTKGISKQDFSENEDQTPFHKSHFPLEDRIYFIQGQYELIYCAKIPKR
jgi:hypothetical protein